MAAILRVILLSNSDFRHEKVINILSHAGMIWIVRMSRSTEKLRTIYKWLNFYFLLFSFFYVLRIS